MFGPNDVGFEHYFRLKRRGLRNRTPSPVPFSSTNSIPLVSGAARIFLTVFGETRTDDCRRVPP